MQATEAADLATMVGQAVKGLTVGIAPHRDSAESEEYRNVPIWLRNSHGLPADQVAAMLARERPELGIESEDDLYQALADGARARRHGENDYCRQAEEHYNRADTPATRGGNTRMAASGFDPEAAKVAVQHFAAALELVDGAALEQLRAAWREAYATSGHKALARYLLTGDLQQACKKLDKMAVN